MARFRAAMQAVGRRITTRLGHKAGITTLLSGWRAGVEVRATGYDDGVDVFEVYMTSGSVGGGLWAIGHVRFDPATGNRKWVPDPSFTTTVPVSPVTV